MKTPPMDLKTFAGNEFDPKKWINKAWSSSGNQEKEIFVANAVSRLQLYMKQLTNSLDETTTQIVTSLPRVIQEAAVLQKDGGALQQKLLALEQKVQSVEAQTGSSIESLQRIDKLKSRLENAASTLQEADKWVALTSSLEQLLETGVPTQGEPLTELAKRVAAMTQSLEVLSEAPDYDRKRLQLETLYNRLEAAVSPPLIDALTHMDAERATLFVGVFAGMGRAQAAGRSWRRAAAARLAAAWARPPGGAHSVPALGRLLLADASDQVHWLTSVLRSERPLTELVTLYTDLLLSLEPSPTKLAAAALRLAPSPERAVDALADLRRDLDHFAAGMRNVLEAPRPNKEDVPVAAVLELGRAAYAPLRELLPSYAELQTQLLLRHLDDPVLMQEDMVEGARGLLRLAERCAGWLAGALARGRAVAGRAARPYHAAALQNFVEAFASHISAHSRRVEAAFLSSVSAGGGGGVLSPAFPAALALQAAAAALLRTLAAPQDDGANPPAAPSRGPLEDTDALLEAEAEAEAEGGAPAAPGRAALLRAGDHLHALAQAVLRQPVDAQLDKVTQLAVWSTNDALVADLPDFALSPQEYITEIGQYLMTLPQHLELHLSEKQAPWQYLTDVCVHTCDVYAEKILSIRNMDELGTKRCLTDISYLASVVEDLGSSITPSLAALEASLRAATAPAQTNTTQNTIK